MANVVPEMFELVDGQCKRAVIRVIGVGGGGCNTVNQMAAANIQGVEFISANTDRDHLEKCVPTLQLQLGAEVTRSPAYATGVGLLLFARQQRPAGGSHLSGTAGMQHWMGRVQGWLKGHF